MIKSFRFNESTYYFDTNTLKLFKNKINKKENNKVQLLNSIQNERILNKLVFNVANTCNLACKYCYASCGNYGRNNTLMTQEIAQNIIKNVSSEFDKIQTVYFFGGEPTINFKVIKFAVEELNKYFTISDYRIVTNATILSDEMIEFFIANNFKVYISIDGPKHINDFTRGNNFSNLIAAIDKFKNSKIGSKLELICTYTKYHVDNIEFSELERFYQQLNVKYSISDVITHDKLLAIKKSNKQKLINEKLYIDNSFDRILNNSLNVGISVYVRNVVDAILYKTPTDCFCKELRNSYSRVYDYNGEIYSCIRLIGTFKSDDERVSECNNKNSVQCSKCWAKNMCRDCVADVILGNNKQCYLSKNCYKKTLYNYALKKFIQLYNENNQKANLFIDNYLKNYLF